MSGSDRRLKLGEENSSPIDRLIGAGLRQQREQRTFSVSQLANAAGVDGDDILLWETGEARIPPHILLLLIDALELDPPWFFESLHDMELRCQERIGHNQS
jgi:transcriptional regulator with XRE-family HTH domain